MSIATRLDSPTQASFVAGTRNPVIAPDVTAPYRATSARRHHKRVTGEQPTVEKASTAQTPTVANLTTGQTMHDEATQLATSVGLAAPVAAAAEAAIKAAPAAPSRFLQPSWVIVAAVAAAVGFIVWWVMFERLPDIDPRQIVATNLASGQAAFDDQRYVEPADRSALRYYTTVLTIDPTNATARSRIDRIADIYIEEAKARLISGKLADAGLALERARSARPDHPQLARLNSLLRDELTQILVQSRAPADATKSVVIKDAALAKPARVVEKREPSIATAGKRDEPLRAVTPPPTPINLAQLDAARRSINEAPVNQVTSNTRTASSVDNTAGAAPVLPPTTNEVSSPSGSADATGSAPLTAQAITPPPAVASPPKVVKFVQPTYPNDALMRGIQGWVDVSLRVSPSGDVIDPRVEDSTRGRLFERAALTAVRQWKYESRAAGAPSFDERLTVRVEFKLTN